MNYSSMPEVPPIEAYEVGPDLDATFAETETASDKLSFAEADSPFWRINANSDWIEREIPRRQWIVPSYLMKGKVSALIGAPEAGKSTLALKQAISLALDVPFGDYRPCALPGEARRSRRVLILNAEDDEQEQRRRIGALTRETGRKVADLQDNLMRMRPRENTAKLFDPGIGGGEVYPTEAFKNLKMMLKEQRVDVLILDPLVELMGGADENSNAVMGTVFGELRAMAEECGIAILVVHHVKKGASVAGSLEAARGAGALGGSVRCAHTLSMMSEGDADKLGILEDQRRYYLRLDSAKQSYAPPPDGAVWLQRFSIDLDNGESAPGLTSWTPPKAKEMSLDELAPIAEAVKQGADSGLPFSLKLSGDARSIKHMLEAKGIAGKAAQDRVIEALRVQFGMVNAAYQRRNDQGQKRGSNLGARIGTLPAVEWVTPSDDNPGSSSGSDDDAD